jgi:hypothetical protein
MGKFGFKTKFGWLDARVGRYANGHLGIQLLQDGFPYASLSSNLVDTELESREFHFDINKLSDLYGDLMDCGHFEDTGREDNSGYCTYPVLKLKDHIEIVEG